jgi:hypothetical protein
MTLKYILSVCALTAVSSLSHAAWESAHSDSANTGFVMVATAPAQHPPQTQPLGSIAPGANPVVGPNGDVYIGNLEGELRAFHADGTPYWTRKLNSLHGGIFAAPVVGADGRSMSCRAFTTRITRMACAMNAMILTCTSSVRAEPGSSGRLSRSNFLISLRSKTEAPLPRRRTSGAGIAPRRSSYRCYTGDLVTEPTHGLPT